MINTGHPKPIALVCLDLAGTTVRDDGAVEASFIAAFEEIGAPRQSQHGEELMAYARSTMGSSKIAVFEALFPEHEVAVRANVAFEAAYLRYISGGAIKPIDGAVETIAELRERGMKVALLTGFSKQTRDALIESLAWNEIADILVCPAEAGRGRPYPDMVLTALLRLEIDDVAQVAVAGDTAADIATGRRAGASIVAGVLTGADRAEVLQEAGATHILPSVLGLVELIEKH